MATLDMFRISVAAAALGFAVERWMSPAAGDVADDVRPDPERLPIDTGQAVGRW